MNKQPPPIRWKRMYPMNMNDLNGTKQTMQLNMISMEWEYYTHAVSYTFDHTMHDEKKSHTGSALYSCNAFQWIMEHWSLFSVLYEFKWVTELNTMRTRAAAHVPYLKLRGNSRTVCSGNRCPHTFHHFVDHLILDYNIIHSKQ